MSVELILEGEEEEFEPGDDLDLPDGNLWVWGIVDFCEKHDVVAISTYNGNVVAYVEGKGAISLHDLLKAYKPKGALKAIKP